MTHDMVNHDLVNRRPGSLSRFKRMGCKSRWSVCMFRRSGVHAASLGLKREKICPRAAHRSLRNFISNLPRQ